MADIKRPRNVHGPIDGVDPQILEFIELENQGRDAFGAGRFEEAAECYRKILAVRPDWEEGMGFYGLAGALEEMGQLEEARQAYVRAISYNPNEPILWGGYASFLYQFGETEEAFEAYVTLYMKEARLDLAGELKKTKPGILELGEKLGLTETEIKERLERGG